MLAQAANHAHAAHISRTVLGDGGVPFDGPMDPLVPGGRPSRSLLTGISFGNALLGGQGVQGDSLQIAQPL